MKKIWNASSAAKEKAQEISQINRQIDRQKIA